MQDSTENSGVGTPAKSAAAAAAEARRQKILNRGQDRLKSITLGMKPSDTIDETAINNKDSEKNTLISDIPSIPSETNPDNLIPSSISGDVKNKSVLKGQESVRTPETEIDDDEEVKEKQDEGSIDDKVEEIKLSSSDVSSPNALAPNVEAAFHAILNQLASVANNASNLDYNDASGAHCRVSSPFNADFDFQSAFAPPSPSSSFTNTNCMSPDGSKSHQPFDELLASTFLPPSNSTPNPTNSLIDRTSSASGSLNPVLRKSISDCVRTSSSGIVKKKSVTFVPSPDVPNFPPMDSPTRNGPPHNLRSSKAASRPGIISYSFFLSLPIWKILFSWITAATLKSAVVGTRRIRALLAILIAAHLVFLDRELRGFGGRGEARKVLEAADGILDRLRRSFLPVPNMPFSPVVVFIGIQLAIIIGVQIIPSRRIRSFLGVIPDQPKSSLPMRLRTPNLMALIPHLSSSIESAAGIVALVSGLSDGSALLLTAFVAISSLLDLIQNTDA
mmetsp:Transcript_34886/g.62732  ORF Transcript_34886/g.62732 Transcript_34886/m.62732 type:complete len:504 (-) Transcript_34886:449-1960(-)